MTPAKKDPHTQLPSSVPEASVWKVRGLTSDFMLESVTELETDDMTENEERGFWN